VHRFSKKAQTSSFTKIHPAGAQLFLTDGQTDEQATGHDEVTFSNFVNAPKNGKSFNVITYSNNLQQNPHL
jgi:hypothetical protein